MKKSIFFAAATAALLLASCGGKTPAPSQKETNPLWGMWLQQQPAAESKTEIMFNEDATGFVFNADTLLFETRWTQGDHLNVQYIIVTDSSRRTVNCAYDVRLTGDTLRLREIVDGAPASFDTSYLRVRQ